MDISTLDKHQRCLQAQIKDLCLENWLWDAACSIRGPIDASKFKEILTKLGFEGYLTNKAE